MINAPNHVAVPRVLIEQMYWPKAIYFHNIFHCNILQSTAHLYLPLLYKIQQVFAYDWQKIYRNMAVRGNQVAK